MNPASSKMKILILGVNGFIGHHLSKRILDVTDWDVYGMDMATDRIADVLGNPRFHFFEGDITINKEWMEYHIRKCDVVLPLVAIATSGSTVSHFLTWYSIHSRLMVISPSKKWKRGASVRSPMRSHCMSIP